MLEALPFTGTTRVANKGVDVALVVSSKAVDAAIQAAKLCGVCGISTAVLEVTVLTPPDQRTLLHFCKTAGRLVFENDLLLQAHTLPPTVLVEVATARDTKAFSEAVFTVKRRAHPWTV